MIDLSDLSKTLDFIEYINGYNTILTSKLIIN